MISTLAKSILNDIQQHLPKGIEEGAITERFKAELEVALEKSVLVSKQEFIAQTAALERAKEKLAQLEEQIATLEKHINTQ